MTDVTFSSATYFGVGSSPNSVTVGDFNGDGNLDLVAANSGGNSVSVLLNNGSGDFNLATSFDIGEGYYFTSVAVGDFNGDDNLDLVGVSPYGGGSLNVLLNNGSGGFNPATSFLQVVGSPRSVTVGDFNGDGNLDISTANNGSEVSFLGNTVSILLNTTITNTPPVAVNDSITASQNTAINISTATLIANDSNVDNPNSALKIIGVSGATNGTVELNNNDTPTNFADDFITFAPSNGFSGNASFNYTLSDGSLSSSATVQVAIGKNINGGNGKDNLTGTAGNDSITGVNGQDIISGLAGDDRLDGGNGNDKLYGDAGNDRLLGGNGNDQLLGDAGNDILTGGLGSDTFALGKNLGADTITDFSLGQGDKIGLTNCLTFNQLTLSGNQILAGSEILAVVTGFNTNTLTAANFVSI